MQVVDTRRRIPRTDALLAQPPFAEAIGRLGAATVKQAITAAQDQARRGEIAPEDVPDQAAGLLPASATTLRPVINATGVLLHTNLGRAPLSAAARTALATSAGCTDVEYDLATGQRARRGRGALEALREACPAGTGCAHRQQQRRRAGPGGDRAGPRPRDHHQPRRDGGDR